MKIGQQELADALYVEQSSVSHYETGSRRVPIEILDAWLAMLDIEVTITPKGDEGACVHRFGNGTAPQSEGPSRAHMTETACENGRKRASAGLR